MQATIHTYDDATGAGSVVTDSGRSLPFTAAAFRTSGLRTTRPGQRINIEVSADGISRMWIVGVGPGQRIR